jgi:hypothetical protein
MFTDGLHSFISIYILTYLAIYLKNIFLKIKIMHLIVLNISNQISGYGKHSINIHSNQIIIPKSFYFTIKIYDNGGEILFQV